MSKNYYEITVSAIVKADEQPDREDFVFDLGQTAADIGMEFSSDEDITFNIEDVV
jgi:hypothetical protein